MTVIEYEDLTASGLPIVRLPKLAPVRSFADAWWRVGRLTECAALCGGAVCGPPLEERWLCPLLVQ